jgi:hypothetical protein
MNLEKPLLVSQINLQIGVQYNFKVLSSINAVKHECELQMYPWGVKVIPSPQLTKASPIAVYATNIKWIDLYPELRPVFNEPLPSSSLPGKKK